MIKYPDGQTDLPEPQPRTEQQEKVPRYQPGPMDHYCPEEQDDDTQKKHNVIRSDRFK